MFASELSLLSHFVSLSPSASAKLMSRISACSQSSLLYHTKVQQGTPFLHSPSSKTSCRLNFSEMEDNVSMAAALHDGPAPQPTTAIPSEQQHREKEHPRRKSVAEQRRTVDDQATAPGVTLDTFAHLDEKKILHKMDIRIVPILTALYLMSFLDRSNIANAEIEGMSKDLGLKNGQYNWALTIFFFSYCVFDLPSNLVLKKLRPSIWLPSTMVAWGTVMTLMGIVQGYKGLLSARFFLGLAEAGYSIYWV